MPATAQEKDGEIHNLSATSTTPGEIEITWDAASPTPTDYRVAWAKKDEKFRSYTDTEWNAFPTSTSYILAGMEESVEYKVIVRSRYFKPGGTRPTSSGPWSDKAFVTVASTQVTPPSKPMGLMALGAFNQVILFWNDPEDDSITGYRVLRGTNDDTLEVIEQNTGTADPDYTDIQVSPETRYVYAVEAINSSGTSERSDTAGVSTPAEPVRTGDEPQVARQGESVTLVSTLRQPRLLGISESTTVTASPLTLLQKFTTGNNPAGYSLHGVMVRLTSVSDSSVPMVSIRRLNSCPLLRKNKNLAVLDNPSNLSKVTGERSTFTAYFTAPESFTLDPNTTYWIVFKETSEDGFYSPVGTSTDEFDSGAAPGWTLGSGCGVTGDGNMRGLRVFSVTNPRSMSVLGNPLEE